MKLKDRLKSHISENRWQYLLITVIFLAGIIAGDFKAVGITESVKSHLVTLIDNYLKGGINTGLDKQTILFNSFLNQAKSIVTIWFLGLTVIGMPLILAVVFLKGFSLGFTVSFLVKEKAWSGVVITLLSIFPQNLVYIPLLIIWSVIGINFTLLIARGRTGRPNLLGKGIMGYTLLMFIFLGLVITGALIEAYLSPWFMGLLI